MELKIKPLSPLLGKEIEYPAYATDGSAGMDLRACMNEAVTIPAGERSVLEEKVTELPAGALTVELAEESEAFEGQAARSFSHQIVDLNEYVKNIAVMGSPLSAYCQDLGVMCPVLLSGWNPFTIRYASDSHEWNTEEIAEKIHKEIEMLAETIIQMQVDGVW